MNINIKDLPTVSVCMITYGHEKFIEDAINGILMQDCSFDIELILANDCSPDNSDELIQKIINEDPRASSIKYIRQEENIGMTANFLAALKQCKGKYVALCDGDDYWTDNKKLQKQVDFLESNPEFVLSFHKVKILKPDGSITEDFITKVPENYETIETLATSGNYMHTPSVVYRNIIKKFPNEFELAPVCDYFLYMMLAQHGKIKYLEETMAIYRSDIGVMSKMSFIDVHYSEIKFYSCMASYLEDINLKKIFFDRQLSALKKMERVLNKNNKTYFIKNNKFLKFAVYLNEKTAKLFR